MLWLITAILTVFFSSSMFVLSKNLMKKVDSLVFTYLFTTFIVIIFSPLGAYLGLTSSWNVDYTVYIAIIASGILNSIAIILFMKALNIGDLGVVIPLRNLVPILAVFPAFFILGEDITLFVLTAAIFASIGVYLLNLRSKEYITKPIKAI